jgi:hypothetical protein
MKLYMYAFIALFAVALIFGCTLGGGTNKTTTNQTGALKVTPTQIISGGSATIQYTLTNSYDNTMKDVRISLLDVPSSYSGTRNLTAISSIVTNQQYPAIFTITAPSALNLKQTITPKIEVCYKYDTNYYFDTVLKTTALATETAPTTSGSSTGPVSVTELGLDQVFTDTGLSATNTSNHMGELQITNTGSGKIISFNNITATVVSDYIDSLVLSYSDCASGTAPIPPSMQTQSNSHHTSSQQLISDASTCSILNNTLAISNGLTATMDMTTNAAAASLTSIKTETVNGVVSFNYCYDVPVGSIVVCPAGKAC